MLSALIIAVSTLAMEPAPQTYPAFLLCTEAEAFFDEGKHSEAISKLNQCISEEPLTDRDRACALLNRAKNYRALGQPEKAEGDAASARTLDDSLDDPAQAATCLDMSEEEASHLLDELGAREH